MIFVVVMKKVKSFFIAILHLLKRCFCCFKHRNGEDGSLPMHYESRQGSGSEAFDSWEPWEGLLSIVTDGKNSVGSQNPAVSKSTKKVSLMEMQIEKFRQNKQLKMTQIPEDEEGPNFFQDLAPKIPKKPQVVIYARPEDDEQNLSNRVSYLSEPVLQGSGLLDWEEEGAWEDEPYVNVDEVIRLQKETERQERKKERLKKKADKDHLKILKQEQRLATKIS